MRSRGGGNGAGMHAETLYRENDDAMAALSGKVSALRALSYDIEGEIKSQNALLNDMDGSVGGARALLANTMLKLTDAIRAGGSRNTWYLAGFVMFVFFLLWWFASR
mmetsp:Transcript_24076/g.72249  ORF Transcript_24076/g.72249 Transcript_24076/m.72249 type:complete len:107 (-) Transcript_24076:13-333(-)